MRRALKKQAADCKGAQLEASAGQLVACAFVCGLIAMLEIGIRLDGKLTQPLKATL